MGAFDANFAQRVAHLCFEQFDALPKSGKPIFSRQWTTVAGIIKHQIGAPMRVLSLGTGSKCIGESKLSAAGNIINDSHAEVLARRAFLLYLYEEIERTNDNESEIFNVDDRQKMKLRDGVTFHLFTSQTPCGDASIFPNVFVATPNGCGDGLSESNADIAPSSGSFFRRNSFHESERTDMEYRESDGKTDMNVGRYEQNLDNESNPYSFRDAVYQCDDIVDIHRTGAKCLLNEVIQDPKMPGKRYHVVGRVRTKPGRGDRTLSVSCSDKILRWNFVGIQGALLASIIEPVYLCSIIVGCDSELYSHDAMRRAVIDRNAELDIIRPSNELPHLLHIPVAFRFTKPMCNTEIPLRPSPYSIVWCGLKCSDRNHQIYVEGRLLGQTKKRNCECEPLLVSKRQLLRRFKRVTKSKFDSLTYAECKLLSSNYREKSLQFKAMVGPWSAKDENLQFFI